MRTLCRLRPLADTGVAAVVIPGAVPSCFAVALKPKIGTGTESAVSDRAGTRRVCRLALRTRPSGTLADWPSGTASEIGRGIRRLSESGADSMSRRPRKSWITGRDRRRMLHRMAVRVWQGCMGQGVRALRARWAGIGRLACLCLGSASMMLGQRQRRRRRRRTRRH